jgi:uncharacterized protein (DUF1810 family)
MTLFKVASGEDSIFSKVLEKYFRGVRDEKTLRILNENSK